MENNQQYCGKIVYIVNCDTREMYQGLIVFVENEVYDGRNYPTYKVTTDAKESYYKTMSLKDWQYKNTTRWNSISFYFERFQAERRIKELEEQAQRELGRRNNTKVVDRELTIAQIKGKSRDELLQDLLGAPLSEVKVNQSQLKQISKHFDKLDEIIKNENNTFFDIKLAFFLNRNPVKVDMSRFLFLFRSEIVYGKLKEVSIRLHYDVSGFSSCIDLHKWNKFYSYSSDQV